MRIITIQPSAHTDHILEDGTELQQLPYPFHVEPSGTIQRQDFWKGRPLLLVGFQRDLHVQQVDLLHGDWWLDPQSAVGMYAVTSDADGKINSHINAIESVATFEVEE